MRRVASGLVLVCLVGALGAGTGRAAPARRPKSTAHVVGRDAAGDWEVEGDTSAAALGAALGQDLVAASLDVKDGTTLLFQIKLASLPNEAVMQQSAYVWGFSVDGEPWFVTNSCNPFEPAECPGTVTAGVAFQIGHCTAVALTSTCTTEGTVASTVDAAAGTITIPVPMSVVGATRGSWIGAGEFPIAASPGRANSLEPEIGVGDVLDLSRNYEVR